jgi:hypothetical protein
LAHSADKGYAADWYAGANGEIHLSLSKRAEILQNNIFGVDIDREAVEVSIMSLYLKMLDEGFDGGRRDLFFVKGAILPGLEGNVKCGNSLIAPDFFDGRLSLNNDDVKQINAFDWQAEFPSVFSAGGFDAVVGNPPWGANIDDYTQYFEEHYPNSTKSHKDSFKLFMEKGYHLAKENAYFGFIVPSVFMLQPRYIDIRRFLRDNTTIRNLWNIGDGVFGVQVVAPCSIFVVQKTKSAQEHEVFYLDTTTLKTNEQRIEAMRQAEYSTIKQEKYQKTTEETFVSFYRETKENELFLEDILDFKDAGINYQRVNVGLSDKGNSNLSDRLLYAGTKRKEKDAEYWKGVDINAYYISTSTGRFVNVGVTKTLRKNERVILNAEYFAITPKILWRQTAQYPIATIDTRGIWFGRSIQAGILKQGCVFDIKYILSILNSKYLRWLYEQSVKESGRVFPQIKLAKLVKLPIPALDLTQKPDKEKHDKLVALVEQMLDLKKREHEAAQGTGTEQLHTQLGRLIQAVDRQIDALVYGLYNLTEDEIEVVEGER